MKADAKTVIRMALVEYAPAKIADETGYSLSSVYKIVAKARRDGMPIGKVIKYHKAPIIARRISITLSAAAAASLKDEAKARGVFPGTLAKMLIENVADDGLWKAMLDE